VLAPLVAAVAGVGCTSNPDNLPEQDAETSAAAPAVIEKPAAATGRLAPKNGEPGYEQLPMCQGQHRATILGTRRDDRIVGTRAMDVIVTFGGDDHVSRLRGGDKVCAGPGNDTVTDSRQGQVWLDLGSGDDRVADVKNLSGVRGGPGDDRITVPITTIDVDAGPGDDTLRAVPGGPPHFPYNIALNSPCMSYRTAPRPVRVDLLRRSASGWGHDRLVNVHCVRGSRFGDTIVGSRYADDIDPGGGKDAVWSLEGNDTVYDDSYPGLGDVLHLGAGNDSAMPGGGPDRVYGDSGNDFVEAAAGADYLEGGEGNDVLHAGYRCDGGNSGGAGTVDQLPNNVFGGPGNDHLTGDLGNDRLDGGSGRDEGHGGHEDGRTDWIESLEKITVCQTPY
jgi:Ca2+-binding RTX toxin-like protein